MATHPGVYCLRTNIADWDEAALWRTYTTLTDLEAVFRSLSATTTRDHPQPVDCT